jgi:glycosyltransferase involved in cell wall biosynthesis
VRSALSQTYSKIETVVVVDGPDLTTVEALQALAEPRLRVISLAENVGGSEARNIGVREAKGEWIALLDDDDEWLPEKLDRQIALAKADSTGASIVVVCPSIYRRPRKADIIWPKKLPGLEPFSEHMFDYCSGFQTSTFVCPREYFLRNPFRGDLKGHQDWDWLLRASGDRDVSLRIVPTPLSIFNGSEGGSVSHNFGWRLSLAWGRQNRDRMTRMAYSRFIAYHCARLAAGQGAKTRSFFPLLFECCFHGRPSVQAVCMFLGVYMVSPKTRRAIRDLVLRTGN